MTGHRLEVADVFHAHENKFLQRWDHVISDQQRKVLRDIGRYRTAALGTHLERCDRCSYETVAYDSCRNRHCPKCQSSARDRWLFKQATNLLPVSYVHVVFTVPEQLAPIALRNQRLFYSMLFRAASETLLEIAADPCHLGARIGILAVLHTWSQNLGHHPHLHCLIPAGGLALDHSHWVASRRDFFLPVRVLSRMFRGKLLAFLKQGYRGKQLCFPGTLAALSQPRAFHSLLHTLRQREWVVYSKPPFSGPEHVLKYLARYTHRVAISNGRLLSLDNRQVRFRSRDSRHNNRSGVMTLDAVEFIRRFLLHVLPSGFVKIRHFGLLANRSRRQALALCRIHLSASTHDVNTLLTEQQKSALNRSCCPMPPAHHRTSLLWSPSSDFVPSQPHQLPANNIQSPYIHRANRLLQIAVSTLLPTGSIGPREVLSAEHCRYGTKDLALIDRLFAINFRVADQPSTTRVVAPVRTRLKAPLARPGR
jgi:Putative transposase/Transposase zinc-binding domain